MEYPAQKPKLFLYARKSTDVEDKQVLSIEGQLAELREFALKENLSVIEEFIEKQSAKIPGRPIFNQMMSKIQKGIASGILSWHPDRLARNSVDGGNIIYFLDTGKLQTLKFPSFWFESTPQGKFMLNLAFGQGKYYVDSLSENTKRGLRQKVRRGEYPSLAPIGYLNDLRTHKIVADPVKGPIITKAFELYSKGNQRLEDISSFLAQKGILSRGKIPIKKDRVSYILTDPIYYGHFRFGGEIYEGIHEPLVTKKLFDKVGEILSSRSKPWSKCKIKGRILKPYTGLFHCGECGMMITAEVKNKYYRKTDHQAKYIYYRCTKKSKFTTCHQPYVTEQKLDRQLSSMLEKVSLSAAETDELLKMWMAGLL
jgi:DNA invertase Pin-like site-specific DNA recombinase